MGFFEREKIDLEFMGRRIRLRPSTAREQMRVLVIWERAPKLTIGSADVPELDGPELAELFGWLAGSIVEVDGVPSTLTETDLERAPLLQTLGLMRLFLVAQNLTESDRGESQPPSMSSPAAVPTIAKSATTSGAGGVGAKRRGARTT